MTENHATDPAAAAHSTAFEIAHEAAYAARRAMYSQATAFVAHLVRTHLPEAATLTINADARELHEVQDVRENTLWHAPSSAGHGLPDSVVDEVDGILREAIPFGNLPGAARWKKAPQGLPYRTIHLPELPSRKTTDRGTPTPDQNRAMVRTSNGTTVVHIRADISPNLGSFTVDGVGASREREIKNRVYAAITNGSCGWPTGRVTVTVEKAAGRPADSGYDLAIASTILAAVSGIDSDGLADVALFGELGLDGQVRPVPDVAARVRTAQAAGCRKFIVAADDVEEVSQATGVLPVGASTLREAITQLQAIAGLREYIIVGQDQGTGYTLWDIAPAPTDPAQRTDVLEELGVDAADAFGSVNTEYGANAREAVDNFLALMRRQSGLNDYGLTADSQTGVLDEPAN